MNVRIFCISITAIFLGACGGSPEEPDTPATAAPPVPADAPSAGRSSGYDRKTFVLCPAFENYRDELAAIVGFTQNPERGLSAGGSKCAIRGKGGDFIGVAMLPAMVNSIEQYVEAFDAPASPVPELGDDAMYGGSVSQPHVVFRMDPLIIAVNAENVETPSRETMITLATRVREILTGANR